MDQYKYLKYKIKYDTLKTILHNKSKNLVGGADRVDEDLFKEFLAMSVDSDPVNSAAAAPVGVLPLANSAAADTPPRPEQFSFNPYAQEYKEQPESVLANSAAADTPPQTRTI